MLWFVTEPGFSKGWRQKVIEIVEGVDSQKLRHVLNGTRKKGSCKIQLYGINMYKTPYVLYKTMIHITSLVSLVL